MGIKQRVILMIETFFKMRNIIALLWLIKIKISMTCVYKEYDAELKFAQGDWLQLKMSFLLDVNMKTVI